MFYGRHNIKKLGPLQNTMVATIAGGKIFCFLIINFLLLLLLLKHPRLLVDVVIICIPASVCVNVTVCMLILLLFSRISYTSHKKGVLTLGG